MQPASRAACARISRLHAMNLFTDVANYCAYGLESINFLSRVSPQQIFLPPCIILPTLCLS